MNILLLEDEAPAARRLTRMLADLRPDYQLLAVLDSVEGAVNWLNTYARPDLMLVDIHLADGSSFAIFRQVPLLTPVIFTTAYDAYTLEAFRVNSIDYLLKPIEMDQLAAALHKFESLRQSSPIALPNLTDLLNHLAPSPYKERLLVKTGTQLSSLPTAEIAYCYAEQGVTFVIDGKGHRLIVDYSLDELEAFLAPTLFFRLNRKLIVQLRAIGRIHAYFNSRLKVELLPPATFETIVSRERVNAFKTWLDT
jgi:DNA-binding LytR/AlgR family response regulator